MPGLRRRCRIAVLLAVGICAAGAAPASAARVYVALGDSPTAGAGAPAGQGYVDRYAAQMGADQVVNLAAAGETTATVLQPSGQVARALAVVREPSDTAVVTLEIGEGDIRTDPGCVDNANRDTCPFLANYLSILDQLRGELAFDPGDEPIQVMQYYNPASGSSTLNEEWYARDMLGTDQRVDCAGVGDALGLNDLIACWGRHRGAIPVDTYPTFAIGGQSLMAAWPDPNPAGHAFIACLFAYPERAGSATPCEPAPPTQPPPRVVPPPDTAPPVVTIRHRQRQRVLGRRGVVVTVTSQEHATVELHGAIVTRRQRRVARLGSELALVDANEPSRFLLRLSRKGMRRTRAAMRAGQRLTAKIAIEVVDVAGNQATTARTIRLVR